MLKLFGTSKCTLNYIGYTSAIQHNLLTDYDSFSLWYSKIRKQNCYQSKNMKHM